MSVFTPVRHARIKTLVPETVVQLRFGKTSTKREDDTIVVAKFKGYIKGTAESDKSLAHFEETGQDGAVSTTTLTKYPNGPWLCGQQIVSLVGVDESTFELDTSKRVGPVVNHIADAIKLIEAERDDVFGPDQLIALLTQIDQGTRVNREVKQLANRYAAALIQELSSEPEEDEAPAEELATEAPAVEEVPEPVFEAAPAPPVAAFMEPTSEPAYEPQHAQPVIDGYTSVDADGYAV